MSKIAALRMGPLWPVTIQWRHTAEMLSRLAVALTVLIAFATACSAAEDNAQPPPGHPIGEATGRWVLSTSDGSAVLELNSETATAVLRGCPARSGSFTFSDDGTAGFSLPGRFDDDCDNNADADSDTLWMALEAVDHWNRDGRNFVLTGSGPTLTLTLE